MSLHSLLFALLVGIPSCSARRVRTTDSVSQHMGLSTGTLAPKESRKMESNREAWGPDCWGYWSPWKECTAQCYTERTFTFESDEKCKDYFGVFPDNQTVYKMCFGGECPLREAHEATNPFMKEMRSGLIHHGMHSGLLDALGGLISDMQFFIQLLLITVVIVLALVQNQHIKWMPDIGVAIPVAAGFAMIVRFGALDGVNFDKSANSVFGVIVSRLMNDVLIPISIFEGAYHVQQKNFWSQFGYGLLFAVVGTGVSAVFIAIMVKFTGSWGWHPVADWRQSFAYAAFIADVDPVATLSIFSNLKADALLSTLVAGEATMNDPIALVIFGICNQKVQDLDFKLTEQAWNGFVLMFGSIILGLLLGLLLTVFLKVLKVQGKGPLEAMYVFLSAYLAFSFGEFIGLSGIIVTLFCGLMMGVYATRMVKDGASVDGLIVDFARLADVVMFVIIGFTTFLINSKAGVKLGLLTIVFCLIARALMVSLLVPLVNLVKKLRGHETVSFGKAFMLFHSGLRGGMTVMMALMVDPYWAKDQGVLLDATIVTVIGMTYLCGCTGPFFLKLTGVPVDVPQEDGSLPQSHLFSVSDRLVAKADRLLSTHLGVEASTPEVSQVNLAPLRPVGSSRPKLVRRTTSRFEGRLAMH